MNLISIIVPIYKVEEYLRECVDSVLNQTYKNLEIILVDDGSPDGCPAICDEYASLDSRVKVVHRQNGGLSAARNSGIDVATGEYFCFVDSDDILHPQYCEILLKGCQENSVDICACKVLRFQNPCDVSYTGIETYSSCSVSWNEFLLKQFSRDMEIGVWNKIYKRTIFENVRFLEGKIHEDIIFAGDLCNLHLQNTTIVDSTLYFYRQRPDSIIQLQQKDNKCHKDRIFAGHHLFHKAIENRYSYIDECLNYCIAYPWSYIDKIYLKKTFSDNKEFLQEMRSFIKAKGSYIKQCDLFTKMQKHRMLLFKTSPFLYAFNAYSRLLRVYWCRLFRLDAYKNGHGI